ncbi:tyrosine-type recombinase/integrase [Methylobrevis pamukkalensis]|uniref:Tyrosine recombinase XerC n=1 Tax=Methylobrevis pamukkalensis TaxID=1439726 RepID=A0A1E3GYS1_9HYPH|nr:site-specific integrase [Methylobrevis pamukkalensis]ODN69229.1 Tyrosine recombinase XerC [Methylobrevis pamukkalensis]
MPRPSKGARLWLDPRERVWWIRDGAVKRRTGCTQGEHERAQRLLAEHIAAKWTAPVERRADRLLIADILTWYAREIAPRHRAAATTGHAIDRLADWWGAKTLAEIRAATCRAYAEHRRRQPRPQAKSEAAKAKTIGDATIRRELGVLRAAVNAWHAEEPLEALPVITLPDQPGSRLRWLRRDEAARLLRAARRLDDRQAGRALARFILIGLHTGTRSGAIRDLAWLPNVRGGWIDVEAGLIHRRGEGQSESSKRRPPVRIPARLMAHLRAWRRDGRSYVVHYRGLPVDRQRRSWDAARKAAGLGTDVTPHVLRHTCVTWMMINGVSIWDAAHYVGMSPAMVETVYGHHHPDYQVEVANRIGRQARPVMARNP